MTIRQPRVLHLIPALFGEGGVYGGAERYALELARHMAEVTPTRLVTFGDKMSRQSVEQLDVRILGSAWRVRGQRFNPFHPALVRHLAWADVVHCHQRAVVATSFSAAFCRTTGRRVFVSDLGGGGWDISAYLRTDRWFHAHLHLSAYSKQLAGHAAWNRARVIYGGVDTEQFCPDPTVAREPLIVFVGRIMPHKGVDDLIRALPDGMTLEVIGRPYHKRYRADLESLAAGKAVRFRSDCNAADLIQAYRRAACVVLPSVYQTCYGEQSSVPELLGQTLLEGMACGIPAICTDVASMPEVVVEGETGFVVPPNDPTALRTKLEWVRDNPAAARIMGATGRQRVCTHFQWTTIVRSCLDAYEFSRGSAQ